MSKNKKTGANHYELLFILPNKYTEDEADTIKTQVEKMITEIGGEINYQENWGKKKLAYEIKGNHYGYYHLYEFDLEGKNLATLERNLRLSSEVLRHQIVKQAKRTLEEITKEKTKQEQVSIKKEKTIKSKSDAKSVDRQPADQKPVEQKLTDSSSVAKTSSVENKIDLKDLNEKLDDILSSSDFV